MKSLKSILDRKRIGIRSEIDDKTAFFVFGKICDECFGSIGKSKLVPDYFSKGTLFVKAESPIWGNELWLSRKTIMRKMNDELGEESIKEIRLK